MSQLPVRLEMRHFKQFLLLTALFVIVLIGFQNCSQPLNEEDEIASIAAGAPFAYDAEVDTIAHMSCSGVPAGYDRDAFFSFAAGAFEAGSGLKYSDAYMRHTGGVNPNKRQQILQASNLNNNAKFQVAVRNFANLNQVLTTPGGLQEGFAYGSFAGTLSSPEVALSLPQQLGNARTNNFGTLGQFAAANDLVQASASFDARVSLNAGGSVMALTYSNDGDPDGGLSPGGNYAYGRGFILGFSRPGNITSGDSTIMSIANEVNLENRNLTGNVWSCPSTLRYMIVRQVDQGTQVVCNASRTPGVEPTPANQAQAAELAELRKFLPTSKWGVDLANRCIVLRDNVAGFCYGTASNALAVRYTANTACNPSLNTCPHYVSICQRN